MDKSTDPSLPGTSLCEVSTESKECLNEALIPGLPDDLAFICLAKISHGFHGLLKCVCKRWRDAVHSKDYASCKSRMGCCGDWLFVMTEGIEVPWKAYDPEANRWHDIPLMPGPDGRKHVGFSYVSVCNRLLVIGGSHVYDAGGEHSALATNQVFSFDPFSQEWSGVASMSTPRSYFACSAICGKVYVAGGGGSFLDFTESYEDHRYVTGAISCAEVYDPVTDRWDDLPAMPNPRSHCFGISCNGKFYVLNNEFGYDNPNTIEVFRPDNKQWCTLLDDWQTRYEIPRYKIPTDIVVINDHLYTIKDGDEDGEVTLHIRNESGGWHQVSVVPPVYSPEHPLFLKSIGYKLCALKNKLYLLGGSAVRYELRGPYRYIYTRKLRTMRFYDPSTTPLRCIYTRPVPGRDLDDILACVSLEESLPD